MVEDLFLDPTTISLARLQAFLLILFRCSGIFFRLPILGAATVPVLLKVWISFFMAAVLVGPVLNANPTPLMAQSLGVFLAAAFIELSLGLLVGFMGGILLTGFQLGGRMIDDQMGFSLANVIDPNTNESVSISSQIIYLSATVIFLVIGGLDLVIHILATTFTLVPLTTFNMNDGAIYFILTETTPQMFILGVAIAAPTVIVVLLSTVGLGLIGKVVPEMNIFSFSFGLRVFLGLFTLSISMQYISFLVTRVFHGTGWHLEKVIGYITTGGAGG